MKLRTRIMVLLVIVILIPFSTVMAYTYTSIKRSIQNIEVDKSKQYISSAQKYLELLTRSNSSSYLSVTSWDDYFNAVASNDAKWITENVLAYAGEDTNTESILTLSDSGRLIAESGCPEEWKTISLKDFPLFKKLGDKPYVSGIVESKGTIYLATLVKLVQSSDTDFKNLNGYTLYGRKLDADLLNEGKDIMGIDIAIALDSGSKLSTFDGLNLGGLSSKSFKTGEIKTKVNVLNGKIVAEAEQAFYDSSNRAIGVLYIKTGSESGISALNTVTVSSLFVAFILIISVGIICIYIGFSLNPLKFIVKEAEKISMGDLTGEIRQRNRPYSKDEIGQVIYAFQTMKGKFRVMIDDILKASLLIANMSEGLSNTAAATKESSEQVADSINEIAGGINRQHDKANAILHTIEDLFQRVNEGNEGIRTSVIEAFESTKAARSGKEAFEQASEQSKIITETISVLAKSIEQLGSHSKDIESIITAISDISNQTNLLALNASIEAARAGEQGKGFAVVADEVRKLAEQSRNQTVQITGLIKDIQSVTSTAIKSAEQNIESIGLQFSTIEKGKDSLVTIVDKVEKTEDNSKKIQVILEHINGYAKDVLGAIREIEDVTEESAASTEEVSATAEEQSSIVTQIAENAENLAELSKQLEEQMSRFKLK
ncbi:MAG: methyl-accepting chemotaxis protein [Clostridia bacterium]|nr:methyl-accepting chemotaxis protein [Clostridia bacterium]